LIALIDADEAEHERCRAALSELVPPMLTTWPVMTECMYLLGARVGWSGQRRLWQIIEQDALQVADLSTSATARSRILMEKYREVPMDLADASLVALAEAEELKQVFTLDADFGVYRYRGRESFEIIPS